METCPHSAPSQWEALILIWSPKPLPRSRRRWGSQGKTVNLLKLQVKNKLRCFAVKSLFPDWELNPGRGGESAKS